MNGMARAYALYLEVMEIEPILSTPYLSDALFELSELVEKAHDRMYDFKIALKSHARDARLYESRDLLQAAAELGHPDAQHKLGVSYSTGLSHLELVPIDSGRSLFLEYMSALSGNPEANMVMGFRYLYGIGVPENCQKSALHYEYAANYAVNQINQRGYPMYIEKSRLVDIEKDLGKKQRDADPELLDYYQHLADEGDVYASLALGNMYMTGSRLNNQNYPSAAKYLKISADGGSAAAAGQLGYLLAQGLGGSVGQNIPDEKVFEYIRYSANRGDVTGLLGLGYVYLLGIGVERNESKARDLFAKIASKHADASYYLAEIIMGQGLGSSHSHFLRTARQPSRAQRRPDTPAEGNPPSIDYAQAAKAYAVAAQRGHVFSLHRLAHMSKAGIGMPAQCASTVSGFKAVAERGDWSVDLARAHRQYDRGYKLEALELFSKLGAMGIEHAQVNAAFLLSKGVGPPVSKQLPFALASTATSTDSDDILPGYIGLLPPLVTGKLSQLGQNGSAAFVVLEKEQWRDLMQLHTPKISLPQHLNRLSDWLLPASRSRESSVRISPSAATTHRQACEQRALHFYGLSAGQGTAESYLRIGDFYYYGQGGLRYDKAEAAFYYQIAADMRHTHAMFNLGIMHEVGDGVVQDLHLSKRFYDQAAEFDSEARLPRSVALALLQGHRFLYATLGQDSVDHCIRVVIPSTLGWIFAWCSWLSELLYGSIEQFSPLSSETTPSEAVPLDSETPRPMNSKVPPYDSFLWNKSSQIFWTCQSILAQLYSLMLQAFVKLLRIFVELAGGSVVTGDTSITRSEEELFDTYLIVFLSTALLYLSVWRTRRRRTLRRAAMGLRLNQPQ